MPSRNFNYTKRLKIKRESIDIRLSSNGDGKPKTFTANLKLPGSLPAEARVFVEAYRNSPAARMRFDWGTVEQPQPPADLVLSDFVGISRPPLFRVKVTDIDQNPGRLLADASNIHAVDPDQKTEQRRGILYIDWADNDGLPWLLDLEYHNGPCLYIDESADPNHAWAGDPMFCGLVYPEVVRRVLHHVLIDNPESADDDDAGWPRQWLDFPRKMYGFATEAPKPDDADEDKAGWITDAVRHCAQAGRFVEKLTPREDE